MRSRAGPGAQRSMTSFGSGGDVLLALCCISIFIWGIFPVREKIGRRERGG